MKPRLPAILTDIYILAVKVLNAFPVLTCAEKQSASKGSKAYPFPRAWGVLLLLILPISASAQTTIVVRRTPTEIIVGADSRAINKHQTTDVLGNAQHTVTYFTTCKIVVEGKRAVVFAGYAGSDIARVDIVGMARTTLEVAHTLIDAADFYSSGIKDQLRNSLERLRVVDIESYRNFTRDPDGSVKDAAQVIFMAVEDGIPKLAARSFVVTSNEVTPVSLTINV